MVNALQKLLKIIQALVKLLPTIIDVLQDLADDGERNGSNSGLGRQPAEQENSRL